MSQAVRQSREKKERDISLDHLSPEGRWDSKCLSNAFSAYPGQSACGKVSPPCWRGFVRRPLSPLGSRAPRRQSRAVRAHAVAEEATVPAGLEPRGRAPGCAARSSVKRRRQHWLSARRGGHGRGALSPRRRRPHSHPSRARPPVGSSSLFLLPPPHPSRFRASTFSIATRADCANCLC